MASACPCKSRRKWLGCMAIRQRALIACRSQKPVSTLSDLERRRASARRRRVAFDCEVRANRPIGLGKKWHCDATEVLGMQSEGSAMRKTWNIESGVRRNIAPITRSTRSKSGAPAAQKLGEKAIGFLAPARTLLRDLQGTVRRPAGKAGRRVRHLQEAATRAALRRSFPRHRQGAWAACRKCNTGLGSYDDDVSLMAAGIAYLRKAADDEVTWRRPPDPPHRNSPEVCSATRAKGARCAAPWDTPLGVAARVPLWRAFSQKLT